MPTKVEYEAYSNKRNEYTKKILSSSHSKKLVMAGPGTGKSHLFQLLAKNYRDQDKEKILVLTFINELVNDLTIDMSGLAKVSTLHSFAASGLNTNQQIYMNLLEVVKTDFNIETGQTKDFDKILHNLEDDGEALTYLRARRQYYSAFDPASIVHELVNLYKNDSSKIPTYDLILVDEYQDFNNLEAELIDLLATKSEILIAGDDDQSLYSFKHAVPDNIRSKHGSEDYQKFELSFC
jgi:DNA helicase-2/ATP-dependent DNA helicase PcrA